MYAVCKFKSLQKHKSIIRANKCILATIYTIPRYIFEKQYNNLLTKPFHEDYLVGTGGFTSVEGK